MIGELHSLADAAGKICRRLLFLAPSSDGRRGPPSPATSRSICAPGEFLMNVLFESVPGRAFQTTSWDVTFTFNDDGTISYEEDKVLVAFQALQESITPTRTRSK